MNARRIILVLLALATFILGGYVIQHGFHVMFTYGDYDPTNNPLGDQTGHIVGGDAYNYIIIGIRGLGYIVSGVGSEIVGAIFLAAAFLANTIRKQAE